MTAASLALVESDIEISRLSPESSLPHEESPHLCHPCNLWLSRRVTQASGPAEQRRRRGATTRKLRLLRAHGLLKKVSGTGRYVLNERTRAPLFLSHGKVIRYRRIGISPNWNKSQIGTAKSRIAANRSHDHSR